ncbi:MAG: serine/threonine protein kinase, partial [Usitatibacter sp.]
MSTMQSVGKYQLLRELGKGATGKVYLAEDPFNKRKVAIKVAFPEALKHSEDGAFYKSMFLNEAALAGKLSHPHIVQIYDAVVEDKYSYIVMEYVEGGTLEKFCTPDSLLETRDVAEISFKCVRALAFAQTLGLTHRDIKPGNILHSDGTEIKIADFGAAINKVSDRTVITNVGSPAYMAPELVTGQAQASHLTDIYALGVVMYYLLAGKLPFSGANTMSVIYQIVNTDPEPPSAHRKGISAELD